MGLGRKGGDKSGKQEAPKGPAPAIKDGVPYVVSIRPGSSAGLVLRFQVAEEDLAKVVGGNVLDVVNYGLRQTNPTRQVGAAINAIKGEMRGGYGLTANDNSVRGSAQVAELFVPKAVQEKPYMGLDLIVASEQRGGGLYERL